MLRGTNATCYVLYIHMLLDFFIEDDYSAGEWVVGIIKENKTTLMERAGITEGTFYRHTWPGLLKCGLVKEAGHGKVLLPKLRRQLDTAISISELHDLKTVPERLDKIEAEFIDRAGFEAYVDKIGILGDEIVAFLDKIDENPETSLTQRESSLRLREVSLTLRELSPPTSISGSIVKVNREEEEEEAAPGEVSGDCQDHSRPMTEDDLISALGAIWKMEGAREWKTKGEFGDLIGFSERAIIEGKRLAPRVESGDIVTFKSRVILGLMICLWPGYGTKERDLKAMEQVRKYPAADVQEAFDAARKSAEDGDPIMRGNLDWILNRLANPAMFRADKQKKKKKTRKSAHVGTLKADWLEGGEEA